MTEISDRERISAEETAAREWRWTRWFLPGFVLAVSLVPLRHPLGDDPYDERFAWRMSSGIRFETCRVDLATGSASGWTHVRAEDAFHPGYVSLLMRRRPEVIAAALGRLCERNPEAERARYRAECRSVAGEVRAPAVEILSCRGAS